jgi:hypothetical protein
MQLLPQHHLPAQPAEPLPAPAEPALPALTSELLPWLIGLVALLLLGIAALALWFLIRRTRPPRTPRLPAAQPDFQPTVAVQRAPQPDFQPTVAVQRAPQPDFQPTVAVQRAPQPDFQPTVAVQRAPQPDFQPTVAVQAAPVAATILQPPRNDATHPGLPAIATAGRWVVTVINGDYAGQLELNLAQVRYRIGRATADHRPDLALHNPRVSREHAEIVLDRDGPLLIAGSAAHGTYVGAQRAALVPGEQHRLQSGEQIWLSPDVELRIFRLPDQPQYPGGSR